MAGNSCWNCRSLNHEGPACGARCFKCFRQRLTDEQAQAMRDAGLPVSHGCEENKLPMRVAIYDKNYVRLSHEDRLEGLVDVGDLIQRINTEYTNQPNVIGADNIVLCSAESDPGHYNPLFVPPDLGFFSLKSLIHIIRELYIRKFQMAEGGHFKSNPMYAYTFEVDVQDDDEAEPITVQRTVFVVYFTDRNLNGLIMKLAQGSKIRVWTNIDTAEEQYEVADFVWLRQEDDHYLVETSYCNTLEYDQNSWATNDFSIGFEFGSAKLERRLDLISVIGDRPEIVSLSWFESFMHDFNYRINMVIEEPFDGDDFRYFTEDCGIDHLDESQMDAARNIVAKETSVTVGPPGTGKTLTIALAAIYLAVKCGRRILIVTARSNSAWDLTKTIDKLYRNYCDRRGEDRDDTLVIHHYADSRHKDTVELPDNLKTKGRSAHFDYKILVSTLGHAFSEKIVKFKADTVICEEAGLMTLTDSLAFIAIRALGELSNLPREDIESGLDASFEYQPFRIHFVGDPYQLQPVYNVDVKVAEEKCAADIGERFSLMTLFFRTASREMIGYLNVCRRGHKSLFRPIFERFYPRPVDVEFNKPAVVFAYNNNYISPLRCVRGFDCLKGIYVEGPLGQEIRQGTSYHNLAFVEIVAKTIEDLLGNCRMDGRPIRRSDIMVITPYRAQQYHMRGRLEGDGYFIPDSPNADSVRIVNADQAQGLQADIVIVDLVRTDSEGFMGGDREGRYTTRQNGRFVVAMTRARRLRIVLGNPTNMRGPQNRNGRVVPGSDLRFIADEHRARRNETQAQFNARGLVYIRQ